MLIDDSDQRGGHQNLGYANERATGCDDTTNATWKAFSSAHAQWLDAAGADARTIASALNAHELTAGGGWNALAVTELLLWEDLLTPA